MYPGVFLVFCQWIGDDEQVATLAFIFGITACASPRPVGHAAAIDPAALEPPVVKREDVADMGHGKAQHRLDQRLARCLYAIVFGYAVVARQSRLMLLQLV